MMMRRPRHLLESPPLPLIDPKLFLVGAELPLRALGRSGVWWLCGARMAVA